ncbi:unnamed protein product [Menidia menidia]|uniref:(Atlantic silverside) hypothetical protein n=1 Tax=Menidia menidia TaxID=238744 RepID=A0A8S4B2A1_9TELE|nr:unnamed protein product [Menidia menidia]
MLAVPSLFQDSERSSDDLSSGVFSSCDGRGGGGGWTGALRPIGRLPAALMVWTSGSSWFGASV